MGSGIFFPVAALPVSAIIIIVFFVKNRFKSDEVNSYSNLLILNLIGLLLEILCTYASIIYDDYRLISEIIYKLYLAYELCWIVILFKYFIIVSKTLTDNTKKLISKFSLAFVIVSIVVMFLLPIERVVNDDFTIRYTSGLSVVFTYIASTIPTLLIFVSMFRNRKTIFSKKYIPAFIFGILGTFGMIIQYFHPELLIMTYIQTLICVIMYFTIEKPDVKMLNEMSKNKELMEQGYEDKYNFLFEMTQEARNPLVNINNLTNALRLEDDPKKIKDGLLVLNNLVRQLDFSINDILNISSLDVQKVKVVNNRYQLDKLCTDLEVRIKPEVKDGVRFELALPGQLPELYGDYMKIRQILYSLLINSCHNTDSGTIYLRVNVIEKYDVCRVVFNISDSGCGMSIEKINEILSATGSLDKNELENLEKKEFNVKLCQKVVKIMGGNLMIKSNIGAGTDVILTIDQRVYHKEENSILNQYENAITNYRKVLIVSQNKNALGIIKKKLVDNNITYSSLYSGNDAIDRIKAGKKFDFIIVDDEMKELSGLMTLKGMKKIKGFKVPVIIMLKEDKEHIKENYLEDGFDDYILLDNLENELDRIIEKY